MLSDRTLDLRDLRDRLDVPRTTLQRNLTTLEQEGWVKFPAAENGYTATVSGRLVVQAFMDTISTVRSVENLEPFLRHIAPDSELNVDLFADSTVVTPEPSQPYKPVNELFEMIETADSSRSFMIWPTISKFFIDLRRRSTKTAADKRVIVPRRSVASSSQSLLKSLGDSFEVRSPELYSYDGSIPYGFILFDSTIVLLAIDEIGRVSVFVKSQSPEAVEWGETVYEEYYSDSSRIADDALTE
ncbi:hypothetical protein A4G99_10975 [Haladaptatus sp. R4]|nr:hypothetical protein A4G99_10975 [Haladaptatus sp. R4]